MVEKHGLKLPNKTPELTTAEVVYNDRNAMILSDGTLIFKDVDLDSFCYFCGYCEVVNVHHIIPKNLGGSDEKSNLITLCPNHHFLIHSYKRVIGYSNGYYTLRDTKTLEILEKPHERQMEYKREPPKISLNKAVEKGKLFEREI